MDRIAFIDGEVFYYWSQIILTMASVAAIALFLGFYLKKSGNLLAGVIAVPVAVALSMVLGRLMDWYSHSTSYAGFGAAMSNFSEGAYALLGVFVGCILAACLLRLLRISDNLPQMLDCMSLAGAAGIAVGRLNSLFNTTDRGMLLEGVTDLPAAYPVYNSVGKVWENRLATFMLQAIVAAVIFVVLTAFWLYAGSKKRKKKLRDGDVFLLFLASYSVSQIVLDSTRTDRLFMRSNGFVSFVQIAAAVGLVLAIVLFSIRMVKAMKFRPWHIGLWVGLLASIGGAGYMEYHVQRHGDQAAFAYTVMSLCLLLALALTVFIRLLAVNYENMPKRRRIPGGK